GADLVGYLEGTPVARGQELGLALAAAPPPGADGVDDPAGGQAEPGRGLGVAGLAAAEGGARLVQLLGAGRPVDGAVDPAAAPEGLVGGVHHGVDVLSRDVTE